jgi:hypothetical protein
MAQLPFPVGWNLTPSKIKALAAYTASLNCHRDQIIKLYPGAKERIDSTLLSLEQQIKPATLASNTRQRDITRAMLKERGLKFANHPDLRMRALYKAQSDPIATAYKSAPVRPDQFMESAEFEITVNRSLGMNIVTENFDCLGCHLVLDLKGDHECAKQGAWVKRHNALRDLGLELAREGLTETSGETTFNLLPECPHPKCKETLTPNKSHECKHHDGKTRKPLKTIYTADQVLTNGVIGLTSRKTLIDYTVKNEFLPTYLNDAAEQLGSAAAKGEKEKNDDFQHRVEKLNLDFLAVSCDSMGYLRPQGVEMFTYLIARRAVHKGMTFKESAALFWNKWSFTIHRENARNILTRYRSISYNLTQPIVTGPINLCT